ncbi:hypothetical protein PFISCL1PPCAC_14296, partial [Pristionchus fissidentatus]
PFTIVDMEKKICLICTVPIDFLRLGILACRACAAFFKRSIIAGKKYVCRRGDGKCVFRKHEKYMCRSCRFDKCVESGMEYSRPVGENSEKEEDEEIQACSSINNHESLLNRIKWAYQESYERRVKHEEKVAILHNLRKLEHPYKDVFVSNMSSLNDMFPDLAREIIAMFEQMFPFMEKLITEDKAALFQNYFGKFSIIEGFYLTYNYVDINIFMSSLLTCVDCDNVNQWIRDEDQVERKAEFRTIVNCYAEDYDELLLPLYLYEQISEREFFALIILAFCDVDLSLDLPDEVVEFAEKTRKKVFDELQDYYRFELELTDYSKRLGNLMTIAQSTSQAGNLLNGEYRTYSALFGFHSGDTLLREIFSQ